MSEFLPPENTGRPKRTSARLPKQRVISQSQPSIVSSISDAIVIKDENLFLVTRADGLIPLDNDHGFGLYFNDCRYLSGYTLEVGGVPAHALVSNAGLGFECVLQLSNQEILDINGVRIPKEQLGIKWHRIIDSANERLVDSLVFQNFSLEKVQFDITFSFASTFEDIFVVRGFLNEKRGEYAEPRWRNSRLTFSREGSDRLVRSIRIDFIPEPRDWEEGSSHFEILLGPQQSKEVSLTLAVSERDGLSANNDEPPPPNPITLGKQIEKDRKRWLRQESEIHTDSLSLNRTIHQSLLDLRMLVTRYDGNTFFAAGIPWFATLFGRDSLITAIQTLAYDPSIAEQTLLLLSRFQGKEVNAWRDEAPGKILHELRVGELARTRQIPHTPYFGTVDATPLFLVLLARHAEWTGSLILFEKLSASVEAALAWIDTASTEDGYLTYATESKQGLSNQGWKDSWDGIVNRDGSIVAPPVALVEVQAYVYEAKWAIASLYERTGDPTRAERLRSEARSLKENFNRDFWVEESQCYALALQKGKIPAAVVASNQGHALWSGIAETEKAQKVVESLIRDDMHSGWGIRTLSERERRYTPLGYHLGTVWPHDNSMIAAGFKRYGFDREALKVFNGIFRSSVYFDHHRLPELFAGFSKHDYGVPVHYPVACHPQAWASGTIPYLMETLLGLVPDAFAKRLRITRPLLPDFIDYLEFRNLLVGDSRLDLGFARTRGGGVSVEVLKGTDEVEVIIEPAFQRSK